MEIITGYTGKPHVTSEQDRDVNIGVVGEGSYVLKTGMQLAAEVSSNNEIKIRDGVLMHQGCTASIKKNTYDSLVIINGSQGMKRIDLIVARYEKNQDNGIESLDLKVIQGTPAESTPTVPEYTEGDIQAGDYVSDMPMYQVIIDGLNITEVKKVFEVAPGIDAMKKELAELNSKSGDVAQNNDTQQVYNLLGGALIVVGGTKKVTLSGSNDYIQLFTKDELLELFGSEFDPRRLTIITNNGDALIADVHLYEPEYWQSSESYYQYYYPKITGDCRINYLMVYRPA